MSAYTLEGAKPDPDVERWQGRILTVGALRRIIEGMDDSTNVVLATSDWYDNVAIVHAPPLNGIPDDYTGSEWQCLTLFPGSSFDARQI